MRTRKWSVPLLAALLGLLCGGLLVAAIDDGSGTPPADERPETGREIADEMSRAFQNAAETVSPSVVPIFAERQRTRPTGFQGGGPMPGPFGDLFGDDLLERFFGDRLPRAPEGGAPVRGVGSGVIVSEDGYVLTNHHVAGEADRLWILLDEERIEAELIGSDPATDLAVIRVDRRDLPAATLGSSAEVRVGQWVIAVGNPYELLSTVTAGIVSAKGRASVGITEYDDFIQTDASINPGNSGGALADLRGRVVGINTAISSPTGGNVGIGFAIPIDMARGIMDELIEEGAVDRGYLALVPQDIDRALAEAMDLDTRRGSLVAEVTPGGPADRGGIRAGDVIVALDDRPIEDSRELRNMVARLDPGDEVDVELIRDGDRRTVEVTLGERPSPRQAQAPTRREPEELERLGLQLQELTPELAEQLGLATARGVLVAGVLPGSAAAAAGLRRGDVIVEAGGEEVGGLRDLRDALEGIDADSTALRVNRGGRSFYVPLRLR